MAKQNKNTGLVRIPAPATPLAHPMLVKQEDVKDSKKFVSLRIPLLTVKRWPVNVAVTGELTAVDKSTKKDMPSDILTLEDKASGQKVRIVCTAVIKRCLNDDPGSFIGKTLRIVYLGKAETAEKGKNKANLFDVLVAS